jgi:hypothetical protein
VEGVDTMTILGIQRAPSGNAPDRCLENRVFGVNRL